MASMAIPAPSAVQPQPREWITPQEQLDRLLKYNAQPIACPILTSDIFSPDLGRIKELPHIASIISEYAVEALSQDLTDWYTSLQRRGALPDKVPALPWNIPQILDGKCPIWGDEQKPDGTHYKYRDKWSLSLKTPETVNELEASVRAYGEQALNDQGERLYPNENPLQFRYFYNAARQEHADVSSNHEPYWILHTNTVVPGSRNKPYQKQVQMVAELSTKASIDCEVPSLSETLTTCFNRKIARGESLYEAGNAENDHVYTYTRVKEATQNYRLAVGGFAPSGVDVDDNDDYGEDGGIGVAALRKF